MAAAVAAPLLGCMRSAGNESAVVVLHGRGRAVVVS